MRWSLWAIVALLLGGCAGGMDAAECRTADWHAIGYEDGAQGRAPQYFGERRKACADHGVVANFDAYMAGRGEGLAQFCRPQNGYRLGTRGYRYTGICPAEQEDAFVAAYSDGYGLYERNATLNGLRKRLKHSRRRVKDIEQQLAKKTVRLIAPGIESTERAAIAVELKQLSEEKGRLKVSIKQLEYDIAQAEREFEHYQNHVATRSSG